MTTTPHYVRFARSLALLGGLGALGAGCGASTNTPDDAFTPSTPDASTASNDAYVSPSDDAFVAANDAPIVISDDTGAAPTDAYDMCAACVCLGAGGGGGGEDAGRPDCYTVPGSEVCCVAVGPLTPPDLTV